MGDETDEVYRQHGAPPPSRDDRPPAPRFETAVEILHRYGYELLEGVRVRESLDQQVTTAVYKVREPLSHRILALKTIKGAPKGGHQERRFGVEVAQQATPLHRQVLPILHAGLAREGDASFYVMPFMEGGHLRGLFHKTAGQPALCAAVLKEIAEALAPYHRAKVVHRDLKPENIMFDGYGELFIADFGIAVTIGESQGGRDFPARPQRERGGLWERLWALGIDGRPPARWRPTSEKHPTAGTSGYTAAEQEHAEILISPATDVYQLGIMLFEMVSGRLPGAPCGDELASNREALRRIAGLSADDSVPKAVVSDSRRLLAGDGWDPDLAAIAAKCLADHPLDRYRDAAELAAELDGYLAGILPEARALSARRLVLRWAQGIARGQAAWMLLVFVLSLTTLLLGTLILLSQLSDTAAVAQDLVRQQAHRYSGYVWEVANDEEIVTRMEANLTHEVPVGIEDAPAPEHLEEWIREGLAERLAKIHHDLAEARNGATEEEGSSPFDRLMIYDDQGVMIAANPVDETVIPHLRGPGNPGTGFAWRHYFLQAKATAFRPERAALMANAFEAVTDGTHKLPISVAITSHGRFLGVAMASLPSDSDLPILRKFSAVVLLAVHDREKEIDTQCVADRLKALREADLARARGEAPKVDDDAKRSCLRAFPGETGEVDPIPGPNLKTPYLVVIHPHLNTGEAVPVEEALGAGAREDGASEEPGAQPAIQDSQWYVEPGEPELRWMSDPFGAGSVRRPRVAWGRYLRPTPPERRRWVSWISPRGAPTWVARVGDTPLTVLARPSTWWIVGLAVNLGVAAFFLGCLIVYGLLRPKPRRLGGPDEKRSIIFAERASLAREGGAGR